MVAKVHAIADSQHSIRWHKAGERRRGVMIRPLGFQTVSAKERTNTTATIWLEWWSKWCGERGRCANQRFVHIVAAVGEDGGDGEERVIGQNDMDCDVRKFVSENRTQPLVRIVTANATHCQSLQTRRRQTK